MTTMPGKTEVREMTPAERQRADRESIEWQEWWEERREALAATSERRGDSLVRFLEAEPWPDDPPGTLRYVIIQPDGSRRPRSGRVRGEGRGRIPLHVPGVPPPRSDEPGDGDEPYPRGPRNGGGR